MKHSAENSRKRFLDLPTKLLCIALSSILFATSQVSADTLTSWNLSGTTGDQTSTSATDIDDCVEGIALVRGSGVAPSAGGNSFSSVGWDTAQAATPTADTDYFEFGFDVVDQPVLLEDLYIGMRSSNTGPGTMGLYANVDGGGFGLTPIHTISMVTAPTAGFLNLVLDLSSLSPVESSLRLRLIEIGNSDAAPPGATGAAGTYRVTAYFVDGQFDRDMQITGTCIPEPTSIVLVGITVSGLLVRRRFI